MKKTSMVLCLLGSIILLTGCGKVKVPADEVAYVGLDYHVVESELKDAGFSDIQTQNIDDLTSDSSMPDGAVEKVMINGSDIFQEKESFPKDASIIITYHNIPKRIFSLTDEEIQSSDKGILKERIKADGFNGDISFREVYDLDPDTINGGYRNEVTINGDIASSQMEYPFDASFSIICHYPYEKYDVMVHVNCVSNLFFNKYDVTVRLDGENAGIVEHGKSSDYSFRLKEGQYILGFSESGYESVLGETVLDVKSDIEASYKLYLYSDEISVTTEYYDEKIDIANDEIKMELSADTFKYNNYQDMILQLEKMGFSNIRTNVMEDVILGIITSVGETESVSIDGNKDFRRGDIFKKNATVIVTYHDEVKETVPEDESNNDTEKENVPAQKDFDKNEQKSVQSDDEWSDLIGANLAEAKKRVKEKGYTATYVYSNSGEDATGDVEYYTDAHYVNDSKVTKIGNVNTDKKTVEIIFKPADAKDSDDMKKEYKELEDKLGLDVAWGNVEIYGKKQYPYGFKIHLVTGILAETPKDGDTWFLKAKCEIKNKNGTKKECVVEAYVTGTSDDPKIESFIVY